MNEGYRRTVIEQREENFDREILKFREKCTIWCCLLILLEALPAVLRPVGMQDKTE